jgi:hypothetical protein
VHGTYVRLTCVQGVAVNKKGEFWVEAQFLSKLHTKNGYILLKLLLKGTNYGFLLPVIPCTVRHSGRSFLINEFDPPILGQQQDGVR